MSVNNVTIGTTTLIRAYQGRKDAEEDPQWEVVKTPAFPDRPALPKSRSRRRVFGLTFGMNTNQHELESVCIRVHSWLLTPPAPDDLNDSAASFSDDGRADWNDGTGLEPGEGSGRNGGASIRRNCATIERPTETLRHLRTEFIINFRRYHRGGVTLAKRNIKLLSYLAPTCHNRERWNRDVPLHGFW